MFLFVFSASMTYCAFQLSIWKGLMGLMWDYNHMFEYWLINFSKCLWIPILFASINCNLLLFLWLSIIALTITNVVMAISFYKCNQKNDLMTYYFLNYYLLAEHLILILLAIVPLFFSFNRIIYHRYCFDS